MQLLDRQRDGRDFLHELRADQVGQRAATRAGDEDATVVRSDASFVLHALEELQQLLGLLGFVALVVLPDDLVGFGFDDHGLHRGRADIHADHVDRFVPGLGCHLARLGEDAGGQGIFRRAQISKGIELDVDLRWAVFTGSGLVRVTHLASVMLRVLSPHFGRFGAETPVYVCRP